MSAKTKQIFREKLGSGPRVWKRLRSDLRVQKGWEPLAYCMADLQLNSTPVMIIRSYCKHTAFCQFVIKRSLYYYYIMLKHLQECHINPYNKRM